MKYEIITVDLKRDVVDWVSALLYDYPIQGVEIVDPYITEEEQAHMFVDAFEIDNVKKDIVPVKFYLSEEDDVVKIVEDVRVFFEDLVKREDIGPVNLRLEATEDADWANNWKAYYKPFWVNDRIAVKPVWEELPTDSPYQKASVLITIDPGMAFGSGTHETTSLCIKALEDYINPGDSFVDVGCGSGILGIAAAKLGAGEGKLVDLDASAVTIAKENVALNKVDETLTVIHGDLLEKVTEPVDLVVANIFAEVIVGVTPDVIRILKDKGIFIASGIITEKEDMVTHALKENGMDIVTVNHDGGWVAVVARKR